MNTLEYVAIEQVDAQSMILPAHMRHAHLEGARLALLGRVKENELPEEFVQKALDAGDECHAIMDGNTLASYGWYSKAPTAAPQYVYMYKGFTSEAYRGQGLHTIGVMLALNEYRDQGFKGVLLSPSAH